VRYSLATGAAIGDVTAGATDTTPAFSPEGDRVAFDRDGQIVVKDLAGGGERMIGPGNYPFWGGSRTLPVRVAGTLRARKLRKGRVAARVDCPAKCSVSASLQVARKTARRLRAGRTIATASGSSAGAGTVRLRLKPTRAARKRLARVRAYRATLRVTTRIAGGASTTTAPVRIRR
jgi:hypothetical protein